MADDSKIIAQEQRTNKNISKTNITFIFSTSDKNILTNESFYCLSRWLQMLSNVYICLCIHERFTNTTLFEEEGQQYQNFYGLKEIFF